MNMFESLNKGQKLFTIEVKNPIFRKLSTFESGEKLQVLGMYKNKKSTFGEQPVFIVQTNKKDIFFVNVSKKHCETVDIICKNKEMVDLVNKGQCFIQVCTYYSNKFKKECYDFNFIEEQKNFFIDTSIDIENSVF